MPLDLLSLVQRWQGRIEMRINKGSDAFEALLSDHADSSWHGALDPSGDGVSDVLNQRRLTGQILVGALDVDVADSRRSRSEPRVTRTRERGLVGGVGQQKHRHGSVRQI